MSPAYYFKELWRYIKTAKSAVFGSTVVVAIAVLLLGIFVTISINSYNLMKLIRDKIEIDAYLIDNFNESDTANLLRIKNEISNISGVKSVKYISKSDAAKIFEQDFGKEILEVFDYNPLPPSFKISLYDEWKTSDRIERIKASVQKISGDFTDVIYAQQNLAILERNSTSLVFLIISLLIVIGFASVFLVSNTIKLMISAKKNTIELMKLIGASKETIRIPFLLEGFLQGLAGSILSVILLQFFLKIFYSTYTNNDFNFSIISTIPGLISMIIFGVLLGSFGSFFSIRRFLKYY